MNRYFCDDTTGYAKRLIDAPFRRKCTIYKDGFCTGDSNAQCESSVKCNGMCDDCKVRFKCFTESRILG
jgi:hypothetical protein